MGKARIIKKADIKQAELARKKDKLEEAPKEYSMDGTYNVGDKIYHKIWDDTGEVLEVGTTEDGIRKIKVHFEKVGIKTLKVGQIANQ